MKLINNETNNIFPMFDNSIFTLLFRITIYIQFINYYTFYNLFMAMIFDKISFSEDGFIIFHLKIIIILYSKAFRVKLSVVIIVISAISNNIYLQFRINNHFPIS